MTHKPHATLQTPHAAPVHGGTSKPHDTFDGVAVRQATFISLAAEMSWQLAAVVIVPIAGGYWLDGRYHHDTPWLTFIGLGLAAAGVFGVMARILAEANRRGSIPPKGDA